MIVPFEKIGAEGFEVRATEADPWLTAILSTLGEPTTPRISADVRLSATGRTVRVQGAARAQVASACARCLKPVSSTLSPDFDIALIPVAEEQQPVDEEVELSETDLDEYTYDGKQIDVGAIVSEQLTLALPYRVLCKDDCAGLCLSCGADLNEGQCECAEPSGHPAFAALADFKVEK